MSSEPLHLKKPPVIESIVDIDCDLPPDLAFQQATEAAYGQLQENYPIKNAEILQEQSVKPQEANKGLTVDIRHGWSAVRFTNTAGNQLVQFRIGGYSFNRLRPYEALNTYLPEIERTWNIFSQNMRPLNIRRIGLRTINQIHLSPENGQLHLHDYFSIGPQLPESLNHLNLTGFLNHYVTRDRETGHQIGIILTAQSPADGKLPVILDLEASSTAHSTNLSWESIQVTILSLRTLKNNVFKSLLTTKCLKLFT